MNIEDIKAMSDAEVRALYCKLGAEVRARKVASKLNPKRYKARQHNNTSGHRGVTFNKSAGKWQAKISTGDGVKHLGYYATIEDAIEVRKAAEVEFWGQEA